MTAVADLKPFAETAIDRWCQTIQNQITKIFFKSLNHQISTNDVLQIFNQIVRQTLSATVFSGGNASGGDCLDLIHLPRLAC